jgi:hypothetical protein
MARQIDGVGPLIWPVTGKPRFTVTGAEKSRVDLFSVSFTGGGQALIHRPGKLLLSHIHLP